MPARRSDATLTRLPRFMLVVSLLVVLLSACGPSAELQAANTALASTKSDLRQAQADLATARMEADEGKAAAATAEAQKSENSQLIAKLATSEAKSTAQQAELDSAKHNLTAVQAELDELKFGAAKLLSQAETAVKSDNLTEAKAKAQTLLGKYPDAQEAARAKEIVALADKKVAEQKAAEEARLAAATDKMNKEVDEVRGINFYTDRSTTPYNNRESLHLYIAQKGKTVALRLRIQWVGEDWLFIERYTIKADDKSFNIPVTYDDVDRDNSGGQVWEWYDNLASARDVEMVKAITASSKTIVRCEGEKYYDDRTVTGAEKQALQNVLDAFVALGGSLASPGGGA